MADRIVRTLSLIGADGAGKTALTEAFLRLADPSKADPAGSTARLDAEPEERRRNFSLGLHAEGFDYDGASFHVLDCPGFASFIPDVERGLAVTDGTILAISAASGAHRQAERLYDALVASGHPAIGVVSRIDDEEAGFDKALADIEASLKVKPIPVQMPIGAGANLKGVVDLIEMRAHYPKGFGNYEGNEIPPELKAEAERLRAAMVEAAAEGEDALIEKYLDTGELSVEEISRGLSLAAAGGKLLPIACVAARVGVGVRELLGLAVKLLPGPESRRVKAKDTYDHEVILQGMADEPFVAQVFRTVIDHFSGRVNYLRILSGTLRHDAHVVNPRTRTEERILHIQRTDGAKLTERDEAGPGEIVVLLKMKDLHTGDTLSAKERVLTVPDFPAPRRPTAVALKAESQDDKLAAALHKMLEEDPSLAITRSPETGETLLWGMGQSHIEIAVERAKRRHGVEIKFNVPTPAYRETFTAVASAQGRFKRQTGGHGQFGDAHVEVGPTPRGAGFKFEDAIVGGVIPRQFIPSVEKGIKHALEAGQLAGYPVVDVRAKLFMGSYHDVDSSDMAFQVAGSMAFRKAAHEAKPILLEPVMQLEVLVPEELVGAVLGDLNQRRARVVGMEPLARGTLVRALCPHAEAMQYDADLRSLTQGVGVFAMEFSGYERVPDATAQKIVEARRAAGKVKGDDA